MSLDELITEATSAINDCSSCVDVLLGEDSTLMKKDPSLRQNGISLLALKNHTLAAYIDHLGLLIGTRLEKVLENLQGQRQDDRSSQGEGLPRETVERLVIERTVLERGVKPLEAKISYQIEKVSRAWYKEKNKRKLGQEQQGQSGLNIDNEGVNLDRAALIRGDEDQADEDQNSDDQDEEDMLSFRPAPQALLGPRQEKDDKGTKEHEIYKPPKISAVAPLDEDRRSNSSSRRRGGKRNTVMEEYLEANSENPSAMPSIGTDFAQGGRIVHTDKDRRKQNQVRNYEEENFVRLNPAATMTAKERKRDKQQTRQRQKDEFFGEDWGILDRITGGRTSSSSRRKTGQRESLYAKSKKRAAQSDFAGSASKRR